MALAEGFCKFFFEDTLSANSGETYLEKAMQYVRSIGMIMLLVSNVGQAEGCVFGVRSRQCE